MSFKLDNAYVDNVCFSENSQQGIHDNNTSAFMDIYPNPFNTFFVLRFDSDTEKDLQMSVTDVLGREIKSQSWHTTAGTNRMEIDMQTCVPGVYFINISDGSKTISRKAVKY